MTRLLPASLVLAASLVSAAALAGEPATKDTAGGAAVEQPADDGFQPVDPASLEAVSGASLMIAAYTVIVGAITLYCLLLLLRERSTTRAIRRLEQQLNRQQKR